MLNIILPMQNKIQYRIIRSARRRRTAFRFAPDGILEILAPETESELILQRLIDVNREIIEKLRIRTPERQQLNFEEGNMFMLLGKPYPLHLTHRLRIFDNAFMIPRGTNEEMRNSMIQLYRELALHIISKRITPYQEAANAVPEKIQISSANTRWGSCTAQKHITFSWKLIQCPLECVDYVIVHELSHLKEMNHSPQFWKHVAQLIPDYRIKRKKLRDFSSKLPVWD
jgi:predicted metal-dependent hydrolase